MFRFADIDGDQLMDAASCAVAGLQVWKGLGHGAFAPYVLYPPPSPWWGARLDLADADGDGDLDALQTTFGPQSCSIMLNDGNGAFGDGSATAFPGGPPVGPYNFGRFVDLDGDGDSDIVLGAMPMRAFFNNGRGVFTEDPTAMPNVPQQTADVEFADLDGDGDVDFVTANGSWGPIEPDYAFFNDGRGHFHTYSTLHSRQIPSLLVRTLDLEGDGDRDVLIVGINSQSLLLRNDGGGIFTDVSQRLSRWNSRSPSLIAAAVGDVDLDGDFDIVRSSGNVLYLDVNRGDGTFEPMSPEHFWGTPNFVVGQDGLYLLDVDQDGDLDLFFGHGLQTEIAWGAATHLQAPGAATIGSNVTLRMFGFDGVATLALCGPRLTVPLQTPFGHLWLDPATTVTDPALVLVPPSGLASRTLRVPNVAALRGRFVHFQAFHFAPARAWMRLTNLAWVGLQ
ncbi:MAG: VCBS repeat-containing protein [Planctomycetota bacterium]